MRLRPRAGRLRNFKLCAVLRVAFVYGCTKDEFRICQFSIQGNHIHLICEAANNAFLSKGVKAWAIRVARGLNRHLGETGSVFADRYHLVVMKTPKHVRNELCYVLQNARRHGEYLEPNFGG